ncbi:DUF4275 family protein [Planococcus shixiaomingii]|uniref:DUF4275 family protein n=1 Tax=Planococcus shixiaomingii TaxID=3058393 RepID=UPI0026237F0B|nr:DUF4275 family protein [Planococcus sp. N022]WKA53206.1 DUF4275 family protein [Planococcus sp. N022]
MEDFVQKQLNRLQDRNISFEVMPNRKNELELRWEEAFAKDMSKSQKRKMAFKQCMWNVFSWGKIECLKEQRAIEAFDQQKKAGCYLIYAFDEEAIYIPKASRLKAKDITHIASPTDEETNVNIERFGNNPGVTYLLDLYIVDELFNWTYILTHEEDCGPYFHKP